MCELLVRVAPRDGQLTRARPFDQSMPGDVIAVVPDGWPWSQKELANPQWRVIKIRGAPVEDYTDMLPSTDPDTLEDTSRRLDVQALRGQIQRGGEITIANARQRQDLDAARIEKAERAEKATLRRAERDDKVRDAVAGLGVRRP